MSLPPFTSVPAAFTFAASEAATACWAAPNDLNRCYTVPECRGCREFCIAHLHSLARRSGLSRDRLTDSGSAVNPRGSNLRAFFRKSHSWARCSRVGRLQKIDTVTSLTNLLVYDLPVPPSSAVRTCCFTLAVCFPSFMLLRQSCTASCYRLD